MGEKMEYKVYERNTNTNETILIATLYNRISAEDFCILRAAILNKKDFSNYTYFFTTQFGGTYTTNDILRKWGLKTVDEYITKCLKIELKEAEQCI